MNTYESMEYTWMMESCAEQVDLMESNDEILERIMDQDLENYEQQMIEEACKEQMEILNDEEKNPIIPERNGSSYMEKLAEKMARIPLNPEENNVVFTDGSGGYKVRNYPIDGQWTFDDLCLRLEEFNQENQELRALYVTGPNRFTDGMITFCAPMEDKIQPNCNIRAKGAISEIYVV